LLDSLKTANETMLAEKYKMFKDEGKIEQIKKRIHILNGCVRLVNNEKCTINQLYVIDKFLTRELQNTVNNLCNMRSEEEKSRRKLIFKKNMYTFLRKEIKKRLNIGEEL